MAPPQSAVPLSLLALGIWILAAPFGFARPRWCARVSTFLCGLGCLVCMGSAVFDSGQAQLPAWLGVAGHRWEFRFDSLSRWFLMLIGLVGIAVTVYAPDYLKHLKGEARRGPIWANLAILFGSMVGVVISSNAIAFFVFWELMALSSFVLVATEHHRQSVRRAAFVYLGATRIGTAFLMAGFLWAHTLTGSWLFSDWLISGQRATAPALLILVGFLVKAGSWPFHLWLPIAHPAAPSPLSAVMSGVMIKTAIYGILRLFVYGGICADWIGWTLVALGAVSAFWGVVFALLQRDIKRLLAYSSVENVGLILLAIGLAISARAKGLEAASALALGAALFHTLGHGVFKSLLFLGAGTVDAKAHTREIDRLGGLLKRMPATALTFFVGCATISALPPLSGFASEYLLYRGMFDIAVTSLSGEVRFILLLLMAWVALVGALAFACFIKAFGIAFLANPRSPEAERATEGSRSMVAACVFLAGLCVFLGVASPLVWSTLYRLDLVTMELPNPLPLALMIAVTVPMLALLAVAMRKLANRNPARTYLTWNCGFGPLSPRTQYTATSFAQPISKLFGSLYRYDIEVDEEGERTTHLPTNISVELSHEPYLESRVYGPILSRFTTLSEGILKKFQAGGVHQYLLSMIITLVLLLLLGGLR